MQTLKIGDVTITSIIERDGPWRRPEDMFPAYDPEVGRQHLRGLDSFVFDIASGRMVITYQTFVVHVRGPRRAGAGSDPQGYRGGLMPSFRTRTIGLSPTRTPTIGCRRGAHLSGPKETRITARVVIWPGGVSREQATPARSSLISTLPGTSGTQG